MNKLFKRFATAFVGIAMAIGVGSASIAGNNVREARATDPDLSAADGKFVINFYDDTKLASTSGTGLTNSNYTTFVSVDTDLNITDVVTSVSVTGTVQYGKNGGLTLGTGTAASPDSHYVTFSIGEDYAVTRCTVYATQYEAGRILLNGSAAASGSLGSKGSEISTITSPLVWNNLSATTLTFKKDNGSSGNQKRITIYAIVCEYSTSSTPSSHFTVTYDANGGTGTVPTDNNEYPSTGDGECEVASGNGLTKTNYTFDSWNTKKDGGAGGVKYNPYDTLVVTGNITLYAQWRQTTFSVTYDANEATSGNAPASDTNITELNALSYELAGQGDLLKTGYQAVGWNTKADGTGVDYDFGESVDLTKTGNLSLFVKWQKVRLPNQIVFADEELVSDNKTKYTLFGTASNDIDGVDRSSMLFTVEFGDGGNDGKYYDGAIRLYSSSEGFVTITAKNNKALSSIEFTWNGSYCPVEEKYTISYEHSYESGTYNLSNSTWTGEATSVTLKNSTASGKNWYLESITIQTTDIHVSSITLYPDENFTIDSNDTEPKEIMVEASPISAANKTLSITSSNENIAVVNVSSIVDGDGSFTITGKGAKSGTATITVASTDGSNISKTILVTARDVSAPTLIGFEVQADNEIVQHVQYVGHEFNPAGLTFVPQYNKQNEEPNEYTADDFEWSELVAGEEVVGTFISDPTITVTIQSSIVVVQENVLIIEISKNTNREKNEYTTLETWNYSDLLTINAHYADETPYEGTDYTYTAIPETPAAYHSSSADGLEIMVSIGNVASNVVNIDDLTVTYIEPKIYTKVTEDYIDFTGKYLIVYETGTNNYANVFNGNLETFGNAGDYLSQVVVNDGVINGNNEELDNAVFEIERYSSGYSIKSNSGYYIGKTADSNGIDSSDTTKYVNNISVNNGVATITSSGGPKLQFYLGGANSTFKYYKTTQKSISLYRYNDGTTPVPMSEKVGVTGVSLDHEELEFTVGDDPITLTATITPENASIKAVSWDSSNKQVATVEDGVVTPLKSGTATITVTTADVDSENKPYTATCAVIVNRAIPQVDHGTEESPIKVSDAIALIDAYGGEDSVQEVCLKGIIKEVTNISVYDVLILENDKGEETPLSVFNYTLHESLEGVALVPGLEIVAKGYTTKFNNTYELGGTKEDNVYVKPVVLSAVDPEEVMSIELTGEIGKTDYLVNEQLDLGSLKILATLRNTEVREIEITNDMISGFDSKQAAIDQLVTITYGGKTATFSVNISEPATLTSIEVTTKPTKLVYEYGETEDLAGMIVTANYSDSTSISLSPDAYEVTGFDSSTPGEQTITVTYQGMTDTYTITINEPVVPSKIEVTTEPTKTVYNLGDELDITGMVVTVTFSNDTTEELTVTPNMITGYNKNQSGEQTLTITYQDLTATFKITVKEPKYQKVEHSEDMTTYSIYTLSADGYIYADENLSSNYMTVGGEDELQFILEKTEGGYYLKTINGKYINSESGGSKLYLQTTATTVWNLVETENGVRLVNDDSRYFGLVASGIRAYAASYASAAPVYIHLVDEGTAPIYLDSIEVTTAPTKTVYERGEELDVTGMQITATFTDQSTEVVDVELSMIAPGFDSSTPGTVTITIIYEVEGVFKQTTFELTIKEPELTSISLDGPNKTTYELGAGFDYSSVSVIGNYSDGSTAPITEGFTFSEFDMESVGEKNVTVTYGDFTAEFTINVVETLILDHIELDTEEVKKIYEQLNEPDWTGLVVTAVYTNGKSNIVTDYVITGFDSTKDAGIYTITVSYTDKDVEATATFEIVLCEPTVTKVEIKTPATKTVYETTDELDVSGLVITVSYSNGTSEDVTVTPNMVSGFDSSKVAEKQTLTVTYKGGTVTYDIVINRKPRYQAVASIEAVNTNTVYALSIDDVKYANNSAENAVIAYGNEDLDELKITLVETTNGYYLMTQDGKYINSNSSSGTGVSFLSTPGAGSVWKLEAYNDGVMLVNANGGRYLGKDRSSDVIKAYAKGSKNVNLTTYLPVYLHVVPISAMSVKAPTKTSYFVGQELDLEGMVVTVTAKYGDYEVKGNAISVSGFKSDEAGEVTVTVKYLDKEATFTVNVIVATAESISVTAPTKTSYFVGDTFDPAGLAVTENYNDGSTKAITEGYTLSEVDMNTAGEKTIVVTYGEFTAEFKITVLAIEIESIEVSGPTKTTYTVGDEFDPAGLVVTAVYNNGDRKVIESGYTLSEPDMTTAGGQVISVTYEGFIATFRITVNEPVVIESISITGPKQTTYVTGEELNLTGLVVTANYSDGTTEVIETGYVVDVADIDMSTVGEKVISVTYEGFIATFKITVNERVVETSISVTGPTKTVYTVGERLDTTGLVVTVHFSNDSTQVLPEGYTLSQVDMSTAGEKTIIVTYGDFTAEFKITVNEPVVLQDIRVTAPTKTTYEVGEELDLTGLVVTGVYSNGETATITEGYTLSTVNMTEAGEKTIVVTYGEFTAEFKITVNEPVVLEDIRVTAPTKTEYEVGEELDLTGLVVTGIYSNGDTAPITEGYTLSAVDMSAAGEKTIVVTYGEFTAEFKITVNEPITIERISVTAPTKVVYEYGEELDLSGLVVSVVYSNGDTAPITQGYTLSEVDMTAAGEHTIVVTYGEFTAEFKITVNEQQPSEEATLVSIEVVSMPTKTSYMVGEEIDLTGLVVKATYSDGVVNTLSIDELTVVVDNLHPGLISVSVSYQDEEITQSTSFNVTFSRDKSVVLGCHGSVVATSALISITSLLGAGLLLLKKRKIK